jgi:tetratricopeptide (TPR) repeat protein
MGVVLYGKASYLKTHGHRFSFQTVGVLDGRLHVVSAAHPKGELRSLLIHEYTHALFREQPGGDRPYWLNEGLAEWIERASQGRPALSREERSSLRIAIEEALARRPNDKVIQEAVESARFYHWMNKADSSFQAGFFGEAASLYGQALETRPGNPDALRGKAGSLMRLDRSAEAAEAYERLTQIDARDAEAWKSLLRARYQSGGSPLAWAAYQRTPEAIRVQLGSDLDHLIVMASIYNDL